MKENVVKRKLAAVGAALVLALGVATVEAQPASACSLHVVYTLYPWGGGSFKTTYYSTYQYFVTHNMGVASYAWVC